MKPVMRTVLAAGLAAIALYHGIVMVTRANALPNVVMIMDERARRLLSSIGCVTHPLPGTAPGSYLGSPNSQPLPNPSGGRQAASRTPGPPPPAASISTTPASPSARSMAAKVTGLAFMRLSPSRRVIVSTDTPNRLASRLKLQFSAVRTRRG